MNILLRFIFVFVFLSTPLFVMAEEAGIPKDLMWFSKSSLYAGDAVVVYTVIYNSTPYQFTGTLELRDNNRVLGKKDFIIGPSGASEIVGIPWRVTLGSHDLTMFVTNGTFTFSGKAIANTGVAHIQSHQVEVFAEMPPAIPVASVSTTTGTVSHNGTTASSSLIFSLATEVVEHLPEPIVDNTVPVFGQLEQFRIAQAAGAARVIHAAEEAIIGSVGTSTKNVATSTDTRLDKWGGVVDERTNGTSTVKTRSQMKGWDLILHGTSGVDIVRTPFQYVKLFFTLIFSFIINHAFIFYIVLALLIYKIIRIVLGIFF